MPSYAYKIVPIYNYSEEDHEKELNILGSDGWELIAIHEFNEGASMIFKREINGI